MSTKYNIYWGDFTGSLSYLATLDAEEKVNIFLEERMPVSYKYDIYVEVVVKDAWTETRVYSTKWGKLELVRIEK